jgi:hypothetical protein
MTLEVGASGLAHDGPIAWPFVKSDGTYSVRRDLFAAVRDILGTH